ncbi:MAG: MFS transporter [bacterium]
MKTVTKIHQMLLLNLINVGIVVFWSVDGAFMTNYLTKKEFCFSPFGLTDFQASIIMNIGQVMIVLGVLFGYLSDRTRTAMGKRKPYMLSGAIIAAILYCLIPTTNSLVLVIALQVVVYFFIVWMAIPYYSMIPDVTPADKLSTCNAFWSLFAGIGTVVGYAVIGGILCDQCAYPKLYRFLPFYATGGALLLFSILTVGTVREDTNYADAPEREKGGFGKWLVGLLAELKNHTDFCWFMVFNFFVWVGLQGFVKFFTRFMDSDMGVPLDTAALALGLLPIVLMVFAVPVGILGDKLNRKKFLLFGVILTAAAMFAGYLLIPPNVNTGGAAVREAATRQAAVEKYDYQACLNGNPDACRAESSNMLGKIGLLREEPLKTTAFTLGFASAGLCVVFILMAAIAPTLMPQDKIGEYMGLLSASTGLGSFFGLGLSGYFSTLLLNSIHCRVIFIIGVAFLVIAAAVLAAKVNIKNAWELAEEQQAQ